MRLLFIAITVVFAAPAAAQLYVCDKDGKKSIASTKTGENCRLQQSFERGNQQPAAAAPRASLSPAPEAAPAPDKDKKAKKQSKKVYPVVSAATQKVRDKKRGEILRYELKKEIKWQQLANQQIEEVKSASPENAPLISHLENQLHIHKQNIIAIQQELARL